jgi:hypothetical protein
MTSATERRTVHAQTGLPGGMLPSGGEIIPGYQLEERIGAGGYGEVWRAKAPGGLHKAVKIVYGTMSERHAVVELKSLERIRDVRHPFILTLERIEVVDGRLVVVTELAERSLRDCFEEVTAAGSAGMDRELMLRYLHDVADALDYMFDQHSLQHLDIKPENLLLIGGHVKVADFGLTKDLRDGSLSTVAGMTPLYAAPEVFEGKPGRHSDQYSLACVYKYLLTGRPPFRGRTSAQLIAQHLHSTPELTMLPRGDHAAVLKALSKDPRKRFESCSDFVRALEAAGESGNAAAKKTQSAPSRAEPSRSRPAALYETGLETDTDVDSRSPRILQPVSLESAGCPPRPAMVIALGGLAGRLLQGLKQRLASSAEAESLPPHRLLYIDVDEADVFASLTRNGEHALTRNEILPTPLKSSSAYRKKFRRLLGWISRRWLFNMPRSQKTEGIRALGRLAFVDHYKEITLILQKALDRIVNVQSPDDAPAPETDSAPTLCMPGSQWAGQECDTILPRVFIISSIGGGTGSGMAVDAAYAMRRALAELGLDQAGVTGVFLQPETATASNATLTVANGLAFLRELGHFNRSGQFPEDEDAGIPEAIALPPFDRSYFVRLAAESDDRTGNTCEEAVEYLFRSLTGPSAGVFDFLRGPGSDDEGFPRLNSFVAMLVDGDGEEVAGRRPEIGGRRSAELDLLSDLPSPTSDLRFRGKRDHRDGFWSDLTLDLHKRLLKTRGAARLLIATAGSAAENVAAIRSECGETATIIGDGERRTFLCDEVEAIPYGDVITLLEADSPDSVELAGMLTSRTDIEWDA